MRVLKFSYLILVFVVLLLNTVSIAQIEELNFPDEKTEIETVEETDSNDKTSKTSKKSEPKINPDNLIHSGDLIDVDILGSSEFDWRGRVTPEGYISGLKFVDSVNALCRSERSIATEVAKLYSKFLRNPKVVVRIFDKANRPISTLIGAIKIPQRFKLKRTIRLNELIILSGGFTEKAKGEIQILRQPNINCKKSIDTEVEKENNSLNNTVSESKFIKVKQDNGLKIMTIQLSDLLSGKKEANPQIFYGDIITVLGANPIYVIGAVNNPGKILSRAEFNVTRAISTAGGLTKKADRTKIKIFRRIGGNTNIIKVNLDLIKTDEEKDILLEPYDIVDVSGVGIDRRYSPLDNQINQGEKTNSKLPLRIID